MLVYIVLSDSIIFKKDEYHPLHAGGSFILGQEQDGKAIFTDGGFDPGFDRRQGFSGLLSQVELWNTVLYESEIKKLANCEISTLRPQYIVRFGQNLSIASIGVVFT